MKIVYLQAIRNNVSSRLALMLWGIILLLFVSGFNRASAALPQKTEMTISRKNVLFEEIVREIESKSDFTFMYSIETAKTIGQVSVNISNGDIDQILTAVLAEKPYTYQLDGNVIIIGPLKEEPRNEKQNPQDITISGMVTNKNGEPLPGANVVVKGVNIGISTDSEGKFSLKIPGAYADHNVLIVSFIGMETQEVDFSGKKEVKIILSASENQIENVVVTGIFNKKPESYTGAAIKINAQELKSAGNRSILSSISNIDPSFNIVANMDFGSDPNKLPDITMRGRTSIDVNVRDLQEDSRNQSSTNLPLFIMNGFEVSLQRVMDMDEEMVESITLLKDASATALYGSRGANGIVIITTKRPAEGKLRVNYRGTVAIEAPDFSSYNLMNAQEKLNYELAAGIYTYHIGPHNIYNQSFRELYNQRLTEIERGVDTYWLKYPVHTGVGNRHSLQIDGGDKSFKYAAGVSYNNIAGVMKESFRNTFSGNMFFQYEINKLKFQNELIITQNNSNNSPYGAFSSYALANPIYTPYDDEGNLKKMLNTNSVTTNNPPVAGNPLYNASLPYRDESRYTSIQNNFAIEWNLNSELSVRGRFGFTKQDDRSDKYLSREHTSFETSYYEGDNYKLRGSYAYGNGYSTTYEGDITLNYNKTMGEKHQIYAGFNYNVSETKMESFSLVAQGFSASNMANLGMAGGYPDGSKPGSTEQHARRLGGLVNLNYTYDRRYFADFSGNVEGSSKFGSNDRIAPFWSAGLGWNMHHEAFLKDNPMVNSLRLRLSYGTSGSQAFSSFQALTTYRYYQQQTYKYWTGAYMLGMGNPDLSWQQTDQTNLGLETALFNSRIRLNIDLYDKLTDGLLTDINMPTSSGFPSYKANVGEVRNRGFEINANAYIIRDAVKRISWSLGGSMIHNQNKILKISNSLEFLNSQLKDDSGPNPSFLFEEGQSMNTIFVVRSLGIDPATGTEIFLDKDGNRTAKWDASDKVAAGVNEPKVWGNFTSMLRWKNILFNAVMSYRMGGYSYNQTLVDKVENIGRPEAWNNLDRRAYYDRWKTPGDNAFFKNIGDFNDTYASSRFVMKENTLQMTSANVTYEFNREWIQKNLKIDYLSFGFYAENLFYISTIRQERGTTYPFSRKYSFAISARF